MRADEYHFTAEDMVLMPIMQVQICRIYRPIGLPKGQSGFESISSLMYSWTSRECQKSPETLATSSKLFRHTKGSTGCLCSLSLLHVCVSVISLTSFMCRYSVGAFFGPAMLIIPSLNADEQPMRVGHDNSSLCDPLVSMAKVGLLLLSVLRGLG